MTRQPMDNCPKTDALRLVWFDAKLVPAVCCYVDLYVGEGHHGWWAINDKSGGMEPRWGEPREWQEVAA